MPSLTKRLMAAVALVYVVAAAALPADVFFSGDGSVKAIQVRSLLAEGFRSQALVDAWPDLHPGGATFPLGPPFAYRDRDRFVPSFLPAFAAVSAPFFAGLGWRGLRLVPVVAGLALVGLVARMARSLGFAPRESAALGAFVALGTPVAFYAVQLWELVPFAAVLAAGVTLALESVGGGARRAAVGGAVVGAAAVLREEAFVFAAAVTLGLALARGPARAWAAGALAAIAGVLVWNVTTTGHALGFHALQITAPDGPISWSGRAAQLIVVALVQLGLLVAHCPFFLVALAAAFWHRGAATPDPLATRARVLRVTVGVSIAAIAVLAPNVGGSGWGPRYLLGAVPLGAVLAAVALRERPRAARALAAVFLVWGVVATALGGRELTRELIAKRALLDTVRSTRPDAVVTSNYWAAQALGALWFEVPVLRVDRQDQLAPALATLRAAARPRVLVIRWNDPRAQAELAPGAGARREEAWVAGEYAFERWRL